MLADPYGQSDLTGSNPDTLNYYRNYQALLPMNAGINSEFPVVKTIDYLLEWALGSPSRFSIEVCY